MAGDVHDYLGHHRAEDHGLDSARQLVARAERHLRLLTSIEYAPYSACRAKTYPPDDRPNLARGHQHVGDARLPERTDGPFQQLAPFTSKSGLEPGIREEKPATGTMAATCSIFQAAPPARTWISSATILTASSAGVSAPISSPMGECTRARSSSLDPASLSADQMRARFPRLAMSPM